MIFPSVNSCKSNAKLIPLISLLGIFHVVALSSTYLCVSYQSTIRKKPLCILIFAWKQHMLNSSSWSIRNFQIIVQHQNTGKKNRRHEEYGETRCEQTHTYTLEQFYYEFTRKTLNKVVNIINNIYYMIYIWSFIPNIRRRELTHHHAHIRDFSYLWS